MIELRKGATAEAVLKELRYAAYTAGNVIGDAVGSGADVMLFKYLEWTENAERMLRNALPPEVVSDLVHTQSYWTLRMADPGAPRLAPLVQGELESRQRRFNDLERELEGETHRWSDGQATLVVPDTNMFLQESARFETVDWATAVETGTAVRIVVPIVIIHELDRLKRQGNSTTARMARQAIKWLTKKFPPSSFGSPVPLVDGATTVTIEAYVTEGPSRPDDADGVVIAVTRWLQVVSALPIRLVTRDLGMRLRASMAGVEAIQLPDPEPEEPASTRGSANAR